MVESIRHDIPETKNGCWLRDLADLVKPASDYLYNRLVDDAGDEEKSDPSEF